MTIREIVADAEQRLAKLQPHLGDELGPIRHMLKDALGMLDDPESDPQMALWFTPSAIRDHFGDSDLVEELPLERLQKIGESAMSDDSLYSTFHDILIAAVEEETGSEYDGEEFEVKAKAV